MRTLPAVAILSVLWGTAADAQQFGQWTWDGSLAGVLRSWQNTRTGASSGDGGQSDVNLSLGVNGFILHPAVASFRLGLTGNLTDTRDAADLRQVGGAGSIQILPLSWVPTSLSVSRSVYAYSQPDSQDSPILGNTPETTTSMKARARVRSGPLRGTTMGAERFTAGYADGQDEKIEREFIDWNGSAGRIQHSYSVEHRQWDVGRSDYTYDDMVLSADEHGPISRQWQWDLSANAYQRDSLYSGTRVSTTTTGRLSNRIARSWTSGDLLAFDYAGGVNGNGDGYALQTHRLGARFAKRLGPAASVGPYVAWGVQKLPRGNVTVPEAGVAATYSSTAGSAQYSVSASTALQSVEASVQDKTTRTRQFTYSAGFAASNGSDETLREQFDASYRRNDLTFAGEIIEDLPDYGISAFSAGFEESGNARITLSRRLGSARLSAWTEYRMTKTSPVSYERLRITDLLYSFQANTGKLGITGTGGASEILNGTDQTIDYMAGSLTYRPWRPVQLNVLYRVDTRQIEAGPDLDSSRIETGFQFQLGQLVLGLNYFDNRYANELGVESVNKGMTATVRRGFGGTLPIISAPVRRGVVR